MMIQRVKHCMVLTQVAIFGAGLSGCAVSADDARQDGAEGAPDAAGESVGSSEQEITSKFLVCGEAYAFPTWAGWGTTTVGFWNFSGGTTAQLQYQSGVSHHAVPLNVATSASISGQWGGAMLWVTYLGWWDAAGYHPCRTPGATAPTVLAQAY